VTNNSTISDTLYHIAEDGVVKYEPIWSHSKANCPIEYRVSRIENETERELTTAEKLVLHHDASNGWMNLTTDNYALDGEFWTIRLFMRSSFSTSPKMDGAHVFKIEFRDICWDSVL